MDGQTGICSGRCISCVRLVSVNTKGRSQTECGTGSLGSSFYHYTTKVTVSSVSLPFRPVRLPACLCLLPSILDHWLSLHVHAQDRLLDSPSRDGSGLGDTPLQEACEIDMWIATNKMRSTAYIHYRPIPLSLRSGGPLQSTSASGEGGGGPRMSLMRCIYVHAIFIESGYTAELDVDQTCARMESILVECLPTSPPLAIYDSS